VRAAQAEIDQQFSRRGERHARRLCRDQRLKVEDVDKACLDILGLGQRRRHTDDRLIGEENRALRHRMDITGETKPGEVVDQIAPEPAAAFEPLDFFWRNPQVLE
jgi:hypothetical protein